MELLISINGNDIKELLLILAFLIIPYIILMYSIKKIIKWIKST